MYRKADLGVIYMYLHCILARIPRQNKFVGGEVKIEKIAPSKIYLWDESEGL